jgi:hypothetical protein
MAKLRKPLETNIGKFDSSLSVFKEFLEFLKTIEPKVHKIKFTGKN